MQNSTPLLLLHGALGSKSQFIELAKILEKDFIIHSMDFSGHGSNTLTNEPFSIELFADDILNWQNENQIKTCNIFGYSMGGYSALYLARHHGERVNRIFTLATKFEWTKDIASREVRMLDAAKIKEKVPKFAEELKARHSPGDWQTVLAKTAEMMINLGRKNTLTNEDYKLIENHILIGVGDRDKMVTIEESLTVYRKLKNGKMLVMPDTPHPLEQVNTERLAYEIKSFFKNG